MSTNQVSYPTQSISSRFFNLFKSKEQKKTEFEQAEMEIKRLLQEAEDAYLNVLATKAKKQKTFDEKPYYVEVEGTRCGPIIGLYNRDVIRRKVKKNNKWFLEIINAPGIIHEFLFLEQELEMFKNLSPKEKEELKENVEKLKNDYDNYTAEERAELEKKTKTLYCPLKNPNIDVPFYHYDKKFPLVREYNTIFDVPIEPSKEDLETCVNSYKAAKELAKKYPGMLEKVKTFQINKVKYDEYKLITGVNPERLLREAAEMCSRMIYNIYTNPPREKETEQRMQPQYSKVDPYYAYRRGGKKTKKRRRRQLRKRKTFRNRY